MLGHETFHEEDIFFCKRLLLLGAKGGIAIQDGQSNDEDEPDGDNQRPELVSFTAREVRERLSNSFPDWCYL